MISGEDRRPLLLGAADVAEVFDLDTGLASQREAFGRLGRGEADQPARLVLPVARDDSLAFCYAARLAPDSGAVSKFGSVNPGNAAAGRPTVSATVLVLDPDDGRLVAVVEGTTLTALRTSAASALAATLLARPGAATAAVLGPGVQGRGHVRALAHALSARAGPALGPRPPGRRAGRRRARRGGGPAGGGRGDRRRGGRRRRHRRQLHGQPQPAGRGRAARARRDRHQHRLDHARAQRGRPRRAGRAGTVVVDHRPAALEHAGPVIQALAAGLVREDDLVELGEVAAGRHPGRQHPDDLVFYNSLGLGVQDAAAAWAIVGRAGRLGVGTRVPL